MEVDLKRFREMTLRRLPAGEGPAGSFHEGDFAGVRGDFTFPSCALYGQCVYTRVLERLLAVAAEKGMQGFLQIIVLMLRFRSKIPMGGKYLRIVGRVPGQR